MIINVKLPEGEQAFGEGTVLAWKIKEGDTVRTGDVIAAIETPKAVIEFESPETGVVSKLMVQEGISFPMNETLALIERQDSAAGITGRSAEARERGIRAEDKPNRDGQPDLRIMASPAAKRLAREKGVDLALVRGTGPGGRIVESDVLTFPGPGAQAPPPESTGASGEKAVPLSQMRQAAARRLVLSKQTIPHFYLTTEVDAGRLWDEYVRLKAVRNVSLNDFVVKAAAEALGEFPEINSSVRGDLQVFHGQINIGIAVQVEGGLRIPVLREADRLSLEEITRATADLVRKAREGKVEGAGKGTFTISNLGMFDITEFAAIINPPEAAILAVGKVREAIVVRNGTVSAGRLLSLTLSCDHRAFDGVTGAGFLRRIRQILEGAEGNARGGTSFSTGS
jgi:pyruvate dehydrogenase E2 component (dihydrolipoamide acetyltransferase)